MISLNDSKFKSVSDKKMFISTEIMSEKHSVRQPREGIDALRLLWRLEGILLEPVYTAKGMAGLLDLARKGLWTSERVILLHTGSIPATFSFAELLSQPV
jgi:1-aminocyclopropane-1-carboxylate deaminase/D-cysteine desulfhydrase-like pyridoxal-dependent ACC family enzyme